MSTEVLLTLWLSGVLSFPGPESALVAVIKGLLPERLTAYTEGAGLNLAYLLFFLSITIMIWRGAQHKSGLPHNP